MTENPFDPNEDPGNTIAEPDKTLEIAAKSVIFKNLEDDSSFEIFDQMKFLQRLKKKHLVHKVIIIFLLISAIAFWVSILL